MKRLIILLLICLLCNISALCEDGQIDINEASVSELEELSGIGPVKAEAIIDARPFESIDDLIDVYGIGEATLNNIKSQGLACIEEFEENEKDYLEEEIENIEIVEEVQEYKEKDVENNIIILETKSIKTENNNENLDKDYAKYGFVIFCVLLGFLFMLKKKNYRTEFE